MIIKSYKQLEEFIKLFVNRKIDLLILYSEGGLGKTYGLNEYKDDNIINVNIHTTPLQIFLDAKKNKDASFVFDDLDSTFSNPIFISFVKSLANNEKIKIIQYNSSDPRIKESGSQFETKSNCAILCNKMTFNNPNVQAMISRGFLVEFRPTIDEIYKRGRIIILKDETLSKRQKNEVLGFIRKYMEFAETFNLRVFVKTAQLIKSTPRWEEYMLNDLKISEEKIRKQQEIDKVMNSQLKKSEKIKALSRLNGTSIRTEQRKWKVR